MIRTFRETDLPAVMQIWLDANIKAHNFIPSSYWTGCYDLVKGILPRAELYVHENDAVRQIDGFIGLSGSYVEGIFVKESAQSKGIGKQLLDFAKNRKPGLRLSVYQKNTRAVAFYLREQFLIESEEIDANTGEKEWVMRFPVSK